jgi:hypothetical protein
MTGFAVGGHRRRTAGSYPRQNGAIIAAELGTVVIGGLLSSTSLTLLVVPAVYSPVAGVRQRLRRVPSERPLRPISQREVDIERVDRVPHPQAPSRLHPRIVRRIGIHAGTSEIDGVGAQLEVPGLVAIGLA